MQGLYRLPYGSCAWTDGLALSKPTWIKHSVEETLFGAKYLPAYFEEHVGRVAWWCNRCTDHVCCICLQSQLWHLFLRILQNRAALALCLDSFLPSCLILLFKIVNLISGSPRETKTFSSNIQDTSPIKSQTISQVIFNSGNKTEMKSV